MGTTETSSSNSYKVVGDMSASFRSAPIYVGPGRKSISLELTWTGNPVGAWTLETADDPADTSGAPHRATAAATFTAQNPAGSAGGVFLDDVLTAAPVLFVVYTKTSGSGTGTALLSHPGV